MRRQEPQALRINIIRKWPRNLALHAGGRLGAKVRSVIALQFLLHEQRARDKGMCDVLRLELLPETAQTHLRTLSGRGNVLVQPGGAGAAGQQ